MDIYLDANATTPVLPQAQAAALAVMAEVYGNPSSLHGSGLKARALLDEVRTTARRVIGAEGGELFFTSGATEGIQTAVLSALTELRRRRAAGDGRALSLLYGATEHKAVAEALKHWNAVLALDLPIQAIPVGPDGRHDLRWLREHAPQAGLVCTMAANNETGVISDLDGIAAALAGSPALWLVDGVQALGKLPLKLVERRIDYAPFSGHKLYAPKGVGLLYVRDGAPFTPLQAGGGQEGALRAGTENMPGIAALGAVLRALADGETFCDAATLARHRERLATALREAFPGIVFNAPAALALPTTLNFSVPGLSSKLLLDLFDAAGLRVSGGSACSAAAARPSHVLEAMGLPDWQTRAAVRLSFGPADGAGLIEEACDRIGACGASLRESCLSASAPGAGGAQTPVLTRFVVAGACCYIVADAASRRCVVIDPLPELTARIVQWVGCRGFTVAAVLDTHSHGDHASSAQALRAALAPSLLETHAGDALGWPDGASALVLGRHRLTRLAVPGHTADSTAYLLKDAEGACFAFVGDTVMPGALGRSDFAQSAPLSFADSLRRLQDAVGPRALLLPGHDYDDHFACTLASERLLQPLLAGALDAVLHAEAFAAAKADLERHVPPTACQTMACGTSVGARASLASVELDGAQLDAMLAGPLAPLVVDVRESYEQRVGALTVLERGALRSADIRQVPLSALLDALPDWLALPAQRPLLFVCRAGNRSAQAARALRRLGHAQAWSLQGGLALWPQPD
ncbi:aminotransferase class V-fold PLP-dependent enzyme [Aquabacterium humicola]|uniref:aminotransferase class V-fold PLP-dependent enzyme n=1 Tax=Aquabacterium humicola TaxID=3237377 RepID=UPI002542F5C7|nr:aminotransferase class V-fold PLP-dependent enzyme [Rubrivivax pictus]